MKNDKKSDVSNSDTPSSGGKRNTAYALLFVSLILSVFLSLSVSFASSSAKPISQSVQFPALTTGIVGAFSSLLSNSNLLLVTPTIYSSETSGEINYFDASSGACTTTAWNGLTKTDGNVPNMFQNNVGGPPVTAVVGSAGSQICVQVVLTGASSNSVYTVTSNKLSGSLTINTDSSGDGSNEAVFTSNFASNSSTSCTTVPLTMSPASPYNLTANQIAHVWVGSGCDGVELTANRTTVSAEPYTPTNQNIVLTATATTGTSPTYEWTIPSGLSVGGSSCSTSS